MCTKSDINQLIPILPDPLLPRTSLPLSNKLTFKDLSSVGVTGEDALTADGVDHGATVMNVHGIK